MDPIVCHPACFVKQGKSGGSIDTTDQRKGKGRSGERLMGTTAYGGKGQGKGKGGKEGRIGQGGRGRTQGGERPMGTTAYGGKGSMGSTANGDTPQGNVGGFWHDAMGLLFSSAAGGAYWPIAIRCPALPFP